jgi:hypothetical protein
LKLFYEICELLGKPFSHEQREGRLEPKHLDTIWGRDVRVGMQVTQVTSGPKRDWPEAVERIDDLPVNQRRIHFTDGTAIVISSFTLLTRQLSDEEIDRVQSFMASRVGDGAIESSL